MKDYLQAMEDMLSDDDKTLLSSIRAPCVMAVPPENAWRSLCVTPDGELRCYGAMNKTKVTDPGQRVYISSRDGGLSWKTRIVNDPDALGQAVKSPYSNTFLVLISLNAFHEGSHPSGQGRSPAVYALRSTVGYDDTGYTWHKVTELPVGNLRLPIPLEKRARWLCTGQRTLDGICHPVVLRSDDDGVTWAVSTLESAPRHVVHPPHRGLRWQNDSCEPTVVELSDGTLMLLARTSQDFHYLYYSYDGGESWTKPVASPFHATLTMPTLGRLSDGRILLCWCNTQPLPELDHLTQWPTLDEGELTGRGGEDVFTNRDANHAAISEDDGKTWIGFREMGLSVIRNEADFRSKGANDDCLDKSIHQFEILELPFDKVMVVYGQHALLRRIVIFDLKWLYETSRVEDFRSGLGNLSTQVYLKSVSGNFRGFSGHCAWNRTHGAVLVPDPDGNFEEALSICRIEDPRLFSPVQGAVWNFPASRCGEVAIRLRIVGAGLRLSLIDRWFNPIDETVAQFAQVSWVVERGMLAPEGWTEVTLRWNCESDCAQILAGGKRLADLRLNGKAPFGLSYLHLQSAARQPDALGTLVKTLDKRETLTSRSTTREKEG